MKENVIISTSSLIVVMLLLLAVLVSVIVTSYSVIPRKNGLALSIGILFIGSCLWVFTTVVMHIPPWDKTENLLWVIAMLALLMAPVCIAFLLPRTHVPTILIITILFLVILIFAASVRYSLCTALNFLGQGMLIFCIIISISLSPLCGYSQRFTSGSESSIIKKTGLDHQSTESLYAAGLAYVIPEQWERHMPIKLLELYTFPVLGGNMSMKVYSPTSILQQKTSTTLPGWKALCMFHQRVVTYDGTNPSGSHASFSALILFNEENHNVILTYTGTNDVATLLWEDGISLGLVGNTSEFINALGAAQYLTDSIHGKTKMTLLKATNNITVTGHSLGGLLAQIGAGQLLLNAHQPGAGITATAHLKRIETFNGVGFNWNVGQIALHEGLLNNTISRVSKFYKSGSVVLSHEIDGDVVSMIGSHVGKRYVYKSNPQKAPGISIISRHKLQNWF